MTVKRMDEQNASNLTMKHGSISMYINIGKLNTDIRKIESMYSVVLTQ